MKKQQFILSFGSNLGDSKELISRSYDRLTEEGFTFIKTSSFYSSPPWGFEAKNNFVNSIAILEKETTLYDLLQICQGIEKDLGRLKKTTDVYSSRTIDIDIIDFESQVYADDKIDIPHVSCHLRAFVLMPLREIYPEWIHPRLKLNIDEIIEEYKVDINTLKI